MNKPDDCGQTNTTNGWGFDSNTVKICTNSTITNNPKCDHSNGTETSTKNSCMELHFNITNVFQDACHEKNGQSPNVVDPVDYAAFPEYIDSRGNNNSSNPEETVTENEMVDSEETFDEEKKKNNEKTLNAPIYLIFV